MMINAVSNLEQPKNEPVLSYAPKTTERAALEEALGTLASERRELPLFIGGREERGEATAPVVMPHQHRHVLGDLHLASEKQIGAAIDAAMRAKPMWSSLSFGERAGIFIKAAELLAGRKRALANAATMLGQSKTAHQAEIDAACELIDFWRFNVYFARTLLEEQPISSPGTWNRMDYRPLDGFVAAITPFNFSSIAGNLPTAPALMGNTVVWKPASTAALSAQIILDILREAGLPDGVINLVPCEGPLFGKVVLGHQDLGGVHFTGSTPTFQGLWRTVGENISRYRQYPRLVGETGGKDFILAHPSADLTALAVAIVRGGFEYQGQKCSAASRIYVPESLWKPLEERIVAETRALKMGDVSDFTNFMGAVIDGRSWSKIRSYVELGREKGARILAGGTCNDKDGYFIEPTLVQVDDPKHRLMTEEIFGPVVTLYRYPDSAWAETLKLVDDSSPYALTGAVFAQDRGAVSEAAAALRFAAGNFYVNDKPTGAVVAQQPFGGGRASGTNDKAGSVLNLVRWTSPRVVKETYDPPRAVPYPFMSPG